MADDLNPDREKITIYDYDNPSDALDTDTPNENPTHLIYRFIKKCFTLDDTAQTIKETL